MTDSQQTPQEGIAGALNDLTEQTRSLVRQEVDAAQREMWDKARATAPAAGLVAAAAALGLLAGASAYRFSVRLLERWLPPASAALVATLGYGGAAGCAGYLAIEKLRELPMPFPTETARDTAQKVGETAAEVRN